MTGEKTIYRDTAQLAERLISWTKDLFDRTGARGGVLGMSGGVDSSLLAAVLRRVLGPDSVLGLIMPIHSIPDDESDALAAAEALDIRTIKVDLSSAFDTYVGAIESTFGKLSDIALANIKPRLRMTALYAAAQTRGFLVLGGSNRCEMEMGYFTKYGDSGVDALPCASLLKGEVFALAEHFGVPERIVRKAPSAGLWAGQTDEAEMGITYAALDRYLATGEADPATADKIESARRRSEHKRALPPMLVI